MTEKRYWDGEHPNLNDISVCIDCAEAELLPATALGVLYRLVWYFAKRSVFNAYSDPEHDPLCDTFSKRWLCHVAYTSPAEWARVRNSLAPFLAVEGKKIRLLRPEFIRISAKGRSRNGLSIEARAQIFARDSNRCTYCGSIDGPFHIDHIMPVAKGGTDAISNLTVACAPCNLSKSDRTLQEWVTSRMIPASVFGGAR